MDCLLEGRNHCLLDSKEGICCDRGDPRCKQTAYSYYPHNPCAESASYDYLTSLFTCPTADRCPSGNTDLYLIEMDKRNGFSDSWGWFQYMQNTVCKYRIHSDVPKVNVILDIGELSGKTSVRVIIMPKNSFEYPQFSY